MKIQENAIFPWNAFSQHHSSLPELLGTALLSVRAVVHQLRSLISGTTRGHFMILKPKMASHDTPSSASCQTRAGLRQDCSMSLTRETYGMCWYIADKEKVKIKTTRQREIKIAKLTAPSLSPHWYPTQLPDEYNVRLLFTPSSDIASLTQVIAFLLKLHEQLWIHTQT